MDNIKLWYTESANAFVSALPIGNGSLGGMVFGGVPNETIQLNLDTFWSGLPNGNEYAVSVKKMESVRKLIFDGHYAVAQETVKKEMLGRWNESYMPLGSLKYSYENALEVSEYTRELDLNSAIAKTDFMMGKEHVSSEVFTSFEHGILSVNIMCDTPQMLNMSFWLESQLPYSSEIKDQHMCIYGNAPTHVEPNYVSCDSPIQFDKKRKGMAFRVDFKLLAEDGVIHDDYEKIRVTGASSVRLILCAADGFKGYDKMPECSQETLAREIFLTHNLMEKISYEELIGAHIRKYSPVFRRVKLDLADTNNSTLPTNIRLLHLRAGEEDNSLFSLLFQYGRYLLISSSRNGTQPSNLQGIWNEDLRPAWSSNWTININTEMNYWMSGSCNLCDSNEPLIRLIEELSTAGRITAQNGYHCKGWTANHNVDIWRNTAPVGGDSKFAYWPMGGVWLCQNLYEHYLYTQDKEFLENTCYPILKGSAEFCMDWLSEGQDGLLHTCPSSSPENTFFDLAGNVCSMTYSSTLDIGLIKQLFENLLEVCKILGVDQDFAKKIKQTYSRMPMFQIGKYGQLQEWIEDYDETDVGHRHFSPLFCLHPGTLINRYDDPELAAASKRFLERRLSAGEQNHIGWSSAWLVNLFARLGDRENAYHFLHRLTASSLYENLLALHPPLGDSEDNRVVFQIDGNFGATAGIAEMLLQSQNSILEFLPSLPESWSKGYVSGLLARGGILTSIKWDDKKLTNAALCPLSDGLVLLRCKTAVSVFSLGTRVENKINDKGILEFYGKKDVIYEIVPMSVPENGRVP